MSDVVLKIRPAEPADAELIYNWENDTDVWLYGLSPAPVSRFAIEQYLLSTQADPVVDGQLRLIMEAGGASVGMIDLYDIDMRNRRAFIGIFVDSAARRKGFGAKALDMLCAYCRENLALHQLFAVVAADNEASFTLFQSAKFLGCSVLPQWLSAIGGKFKDAILFRKVL